MCAVFQHARESMSYELGIREPCMEMQSEDAVWCVPLLLSCLLQGHSVCRIKTIHKTDLAHFEDGIGIAFYLNYIVDSLPPCAGCQEED